MNDENKIIIYQVFTRLFGNNNNHCVYNGDIATNGCGKMADFTLKALGEIKKLGATHIWYTGIIEHATQTDYRRYNISPDHPAIVKGKAGSPGSDPLCKRTGFRHQADRKWRNPGSIMGAGRRIADRI